MYSSFEPYDNVFITGLLNLCEVFVYLDLSKVIKEEIGKVYMMLQNKVGETV